jgi:hypothetical protein
MHGMSGSRRLSWMATNTDGSLPRDSWGDCQRPGCEFLPTDEKATEYRADPELKAAASERCGLSRKRYMQPQSVFPPVKAFYALRVIDSRKRRAGKDFVRSDEAR